MFVKQHKEKIALKSGAPKKFLGLDIHLKNGDIYINQQTYVIELINPFKLSEANAETTPETTNEYDDNSPELENQTQFTELIGALLYVALGTRPDIAHALSCVSRTAAATQAHLNGAKRILCYLKGTSNLSLIFKRQDIFDLSVYSDANYASDASRKSTSGILITINGTPVLSKSQLQRTISLSTTEAEFYAACEAAKSMIPIKNILMELKIIPDKPTPIFIDKISAIQIASDERTRSRTKHIDVRSAWL